MPALSGLVAAAVLVCPAGGNRHGLHVRVAAHLARCGIACDQRDRALPAGKIARRRGEGRFGQGTGNDRRQPPLAPLQHRFGVKAGAGLQPHEGGDGPAHLVRQFVARGDHRLGIRFRHGDADIGGHGLALHLRADAAGQRGHRNGEQRAEQEENERAAEQDRGEIASCHHECGAPQRQAAGLVGAGSVCAVHHASSASGVETRREAAASPAMATKAS